MVDEGVNFVARLVSPPGYELVRGGAIRDGVLAPTSHGRLSGEDRRKYLKGARIEPDQVRRWVRERLPLIRDQIPV